MNSGGYISWQLWQGPQWILSVGWTFQQALYRFFSVGFMLRTLTAHWHKDAVGYTGSLSSRFMALAWNLISRAIGFIVRMGVIAAWLISALALGTFQIGAFFAFILWPLLAAGCFIAGIVLLFYV